MRTYLLLAKQLVLLAILLTCLSQQTYSQWKDIGSLPQQYYKILSFGSEQVGYAIVQDSGVSEYHLYKSYTYGLQWEQIDPTFPLFNIADLMDIEFATRDTGFMVFRADQGGLKAFLYRTIDGGDNWNDITPPELVIGSGSMDIHFVNDNLGFICSGNKVIRTDDGGDNWTSTTLGLFGGPKVIDFYNDSIGIAGAWDGSFLYKGTVYTTTNGGLSWDSVHFNTYQSSIERVSYASPTVAYAMTGAYFQGFQKLFRSTDSGQTWDTLLLTFTDTADIATGIKFIDPANGYVCTIDGRIYETSDSANSWVEVYNDDKSGLIDMAYNGTFIYCGGPLNTLVTNYVSTGFKDLEITNSIQMYPNPIDISGIVRFTEPVTGNLRIYNEAGQVIFSQTVVKSDKLTLDKQLNPGLYIIQVEGESAFSSKLIVE